MICVPVPNQKAWVFRWLYSVTLSIIFLSKTILRTIFDGDCQECLKIDATIEKVASNTMRVQCKWNFVDNYWQKYCCNALHKDMKGERLMSYH